MRALLLSGIAAVCLGGQAVAQSTCSTIGSLPSVALGANPTDTTAATDQTVSSLAQGSTNATQAMMQQSYGQAAYDAASRMGVSPDSVAAIGQAESGFRNVPTANGTSSASGPWQITSSTFASYAPAGASQTDPNAQAQVAPAIIRDYAQAVSAATGQPATTLGTYAAYVYGPTAGGQIANADPSTPLSSIVSAKALQNNGMSNWTVAQFRSTMGSRLGDAANQPVLRSA